MHKWQQVRAEPLRELPQASKGGFVILRYFSTAFLVFAAVCCQGGGGDGGAGGTVPGSGDGNAAKSGLGGQWDGVYKAKSADPSAELRQSQATLALTGESEQSGTFTLTLSEVDIVKVVATYRIFDNRTLLLDIKESNLSAIGLSGRSAILNYELIGDSLSISNESLTLMLVRQQSAPAPEKAGTKTSESLLGRWQCKDQAESLWILNLRSEELFYLEIYAANGSQKGIWMTGSVQGSAASLKLKVSKSDIEKYQGLELLGSASPDFASFDLKRLDTGEVLLCVRPN